jgi:IS30 family transposase
MGKHYSHVTALQRRKIEHLQKSGKTESYIASKIGVNKSTVCRETDRNSLKNNYSSAAAEKLAVRRRMLSKK